MKVQIQHRLVSDDSVLLTPMVDGLRFDKPIRCSRSEARRLAWAMLADLDPEGQPPPRPRGKPVGAGVRDRPTQRDIDMLVLVLLGWTLEKIGGVYGITKQAVSAALIKLRSMGYDVPKVADL